MEWGCNWCGDEILYIFISVLPSKCFQYTTVKIKSMWLVGLLFFLSFFSPTYISLSLLNMFLFYFTSCCCCKHLLLGIWKIKVEDFFFILIKFSFNRMEVIEGGWPGRWEDVAWVAWGDKNNIELICKNFSLCLC